MPSKSELKLESMSGSTCLQQNHPGLLHRSKTCSSIIVKSQSTKDLNIPSMGISLDKKLSQRRHSLVQPSLESKSNSDSCPQINICGSLTAREGMSNVSRENLNSAKSVSKSTLIDKENAMPLLPSSPVSTPILQKRYAWANGHQSSSLLKTALRNNHSPMSTPTARRKKTDTEFKPKFLSSPSSQQSSSSSFNISDVKVLITVSKDSDEESRNNLKSGGSTVAGIRNKNGNNGNVVEVCCKENHETQSQEDDHIDSVTQVVNSKPSKIKLPKRNMVAANSKVSKGHTVKMNQVVSQSQSHKPSTISHLPEDYNCLDDGLSEAVYEKCVKWLQGLQQAKEEKCLEVVTLPPIEWND